MSVCAVESVPSHPAMMANIEMRWTFVHFEERPLARCLVRSKSAPSEVFVQSVVATAVARNLGNKQKANTLGTRSLKRRENKEGRKKTPFVSIAGLQNKRNGSFKPNNGG